MEWNQIFHSHWFPLILALASFVSSVVEWFPFFPPFLSLLFFLSPHNPSVCSLFRSLPDLHNIVHSGYPENGAFTLKNMEWNQTGFIISVWRFSRGQCFFRGVVPAMSRFFPQYNIHERTLPFVRLPSLLYLPHFLRRRGLDGGGHQAPPPFFERLALFFVSADLMVRVTPTITLIYPHYNPNPNPAPAEVMAQAARRAPGARRWASSAQCSQAWASPCPWPWASSSHSGTSSPWAAPCSSSVRVHHSTHCFFLANRTYGHWRLTPVFI